MCNVYNPIGTITTIRNHLQKNGIDEFKSLNELINFQNNYNAIHQQITQDHAHLIELEKETLCSEIIQFEATVKARTSEVEQQLTMELEKLKQQ